MYRGSQKDQNRWAPVDNLSRILSCFHKTSVKATFQFRDRYAKTKWRSTHIPMSKIRILVLCLTALSSGLSISWGGSDDLAPSPIASLLLSSSAQNTVEPEATEAAKTEAVSEAKVVDDDLMSSDEVTLTTSTFEKSSGKLIEIDNTHVRLAGEGEEVQLPLPSLWRMDWTRHPEGALEDAPSVILANRDRLGLTVVRVDEEWLYGKWTAFPSWPELRVPLETVRGAILLSSRNPLERADLLVRLREQKALYDICYLLNGDQVVGQFEGMSEERDLQLSTPTAKVSLKGNTVRAIGFNPDLTSFPKSNSTETILKLTDGSLLTLQSIRSRLNHEFQCVAACGAEFSVPVEQIRSLEFYGDRVIPVSSLTPQVFESVPYLSKVWPLRNDLNAVGGPLRLGVKESARGLGMHGESKVTYELGDAYESFSATLGIDSVTLGRGSVVFQVVADGRTIYSSPVLRGKSPPTPLGPLSMKGVRELTLQVHVADQGDVLDHANWCDAILVRKVAR